MTTTTDPAAARTCPGCGAWPEDCECEVETVDLRTPGQKAIATKRATYGDEGLSVIGQEAAARRAGDDAAADALKAQAAEIAARPSMTCAKCGKEIRHNAGFLSHFVRWTDGWGSSRIYSNRCPSGGFHEEGSEA